MTTIFGTQSSKKQQVPLSSGDSCLAMWLVIVVCGIDLSVGCVDGGRSCWLLKVS